MESLKHERGRLQHQLQNQKFTPADVERINAEKRELQQTIAGLTKSLEEAEQHKWNEEIALSKGKEKVLWWELKQACALSGCWLQIYYVLLDITLQYGGHGSLIFSVCPP